MFMFRFLSNLLIETGEYHISKFWASRNDFPLRVRPKSHLLRDDVYRNLPFRR